MLLKNLLTGYSERSRQPGLTGVMSTYLTPLTLFTNAVPTGVAMLILDSILGQSLSAEIEQEELIANIVETILPRSSCSM